MRLSNPKKTGFRQMTTYDFELDDELLTLFFDRNGHTTTLNSLHINSDLLNYLLLLL
jgi:hypothetical protein